MKKVAAVFFFLLTLAIIRDLHAADVVATATQAQGAIQAVDSKIPTSMAAGVLSIVILVIEFLVRFVPTAQPRSLLLVVSAAFKVIADIFSKLSGLLDQVVQNLKTP